MTVDDDAKGKPKTVWDELAELEAEDDDEAQRREEHAPKLLELKREHGPRNVRAVWEQGHVVVVKRPTSAQYNAYSDEATMGKMDQEHGQRMRAALERLARQCLVYPDEVAYRDLCKNFSGLAHNVGIAARALAD